MYETKCGKQTKWQFGQHFLFEIWFRINKTHLIRYLCPFGLLIDIDSKIQIEPWNINHIIKLKCFNSITHLRWLVNSIINAGIILYLYRRADISKILKMVLQLQKNEWAFKMFFVLKGWLREYYYRLNNFTKQLISNNLDSYN